MRSLENIKQSAPNTVFVYLYNKTGTRLSRTQTRVCGGGCGGCGHARIPIVIIQAIFSQRGNNKCHSLSADDHQRKANSGWGLIVSTGLRSWKVCVADTIDLTLFRFGQFYSAFCLNRENRTIWWMAKYLTTRHKENNDKSQLTCKYKNKLI